MKAVFSFWSKPFPAHRRTVWMTEAHHLYSWALAVHAAGVHYPTSLVTDDEGKRLLVDDLGLQFGEYSVALNGLSDMDPDWWTLSKLYTYTLQKEPFFHIDSDAYLWKRLPEHVEQSPVLGQNPDPFGFGAWASVLSDIRSAFARSKRAWLPDEWTWYEAARGGLSVAAGLVGGQRFDFLAHYGQSVMTMLKHRGNTRPLAALREKARCMVAVEEWFLQACVEYHRGRADSPFRDIRIEYLFPSHAAAWSEREALRMGFTHLIGQAKRNPRIAGYLENRVQRDLPALYERCREVAAARVRGGSG
ncbi:hypothetical protein LVJ94_24730 [Pendulispora rubella]|uniref:DUF6734 domain-containing protein n=1 Tax=Pendulispora rubella TaxID=2741070 RepID=A0ABZ2LJ57_9BACT